MRQQTISDMQASGAGQPTLVNFVKALFFNPSFEAIYFYRLYAGLFSKSSSKRLLARVIQRHVRKSCSCDISPECTIGEKSRLTHPQGVVIGAGAKIGDDVKIYQNVTIGRKNDASGYPVINDNVTIYAGACILGDITIGDNAIIGANAVVLNDVAAGQIAVGAPAKILSKAQDQHSMGKKK